MSAGDESRHVESTAGAEATTFDVALSAEGAAVPEGGARPARAVMLFLERLPSSGRAATRAAAVRAPTPLTSERQSTLLFKERRAVDENGDGFGE